MDVPPARITPSAAFAIGRRVLAVTAVAIGLLCSALPASAHAALVGSDPPDGAKLASPPTVITLTFDEPVRPDYLQVVVLDAKGGHHESGKPHVIADEVHQEVGPLSPGGFHISYRVVSDDGHPVEGTLAFSVAGSASELTQTAAARTAPASTPGFDGH